MASTTSSPVEDTSLPSLATKINTTISANASPEVARSITPISQIHERLQILTSWFDGSISTAQLSLSNATSILELGCGQGDMTVALAGLLSSNSTTKILAVDPAPLDYGSPINLGQAQAQISSSELGNKILWHQAESIDFLLKLKNEGRVPEYVILAHSLWYLPSETYLRDLLAALAGLSTSTSASKPITVLLAEWGMRASQPSAEAHVRAVKLQSKQAIPDGNVRTLFYPGDLQRIAKEAGWKWKGEGWIVPDEDVDDGCWEVATAKVREERGTGEGWRDEVRELEEMEKAAEAKVRSMDVWTGVFVLDG